MSPREPGSPLLSLVVVVYDMAEQAARTLHTLSPAYQRNVRASDYEVIVVENASSRLLGEKRALASGPNVRYLLNDDGTRSPVSALNRGGEAARGAMVGMLIDGARLVSPGVVGLALLAQRAATDAVLAVPGYHLGERLQQEAVDSGYDESVEADLLRRIDWPSDGYRLFEVACFSGSCRGGFFRPFAESNCLCLPKRVFDAIGGFDPGFELPGGGFSNLDFFTRVCDHPGVTLFVAAGEGTFHQFHGGVTTGGRRGEDRARTMHDFAEEYRRLRGKDYAIPEHHALLLGAIPPPARRFIRASAERLLDE